MRCTGSTSTRRTATSSTRGGATTRTRSRTSRATGATRNWDDERRIAEHGGRRRRRRGGVPQHRAAVLPDRGDRRPAARRPTSTSGAWPASGPTTAGWPTGAAGTPSAGPASGRSSSTTSTTPSPTSAGSPSTACGAAILLPSVPDDAPHIEPLYAPDYDPLWAVCEELGRRGQPPLGRRLARLRAVPGGRASLWIAETTFFSRRAAHPPAPRRRVRALPRPALRAHRAGRVVDPAAARPARRLSTPRCSTGRIGELKYAPDEVLPLHAERVLRPQLLGRGQLPEPRARPSRRHAIGIDRFMWGSDYPHHESTYPVHPRGPAPGVRRHRPRRAPAGARRATPPTSTASTSTRSRPLADEVGPTVAELAEPLDAIPDDATSPGFYRP